MKFTPGPWKAVPFNKNYRASIQAPHAKCNIGELGGFGTDPETTQANARLIAAAPEIYDALKKIEEWAYRIGSTNDSKDDLELSRVIMMQARLLLSRIEGGDK